MKYKQMLAKQIANYIPKEAQCIMDAIEELYDCESYIVGGSIRNLILGKPVNDWDIATQATPNQIIDMVDVLNSREDDEEELGFGAAYNGVYQKTVFKAIPTGIKHGTVTVMVNDKPFEVTTFRKDGKYSDGRRPDEVEFATCIEDDLARRDFTINAIAIKCQKWNKADIDIVDPYNGIEDIINKTIRCVGNSRERFEEDGLRILRALRFAAQHGFEIEEETYDSMYLCADMLDNVSKERIRDEFVKILMSEQCGSYALWRYRYMFRYIIPEAKGINLTCFFNNAKHIKHEDLITRLALLFIAIEKEIGNQEKAKITYGVLKDLKFDNETIARVTQLVSYRDTLVKDTKQSVKKMLNKIGLEQFNRYLELMQIINAYGFGTEVFVERCKYHVIDIIAGNECYKLKQLDVDGNDLISAGIKQGKQVGYVLDLLLSLVTNNCVDNEYDAIMNVVDAIIESNVPFYME